MSIFLRICISVISNISISVEPLQGRISLKLFAYLLFSLTPLCVVINSNDIYLAKHIPGMSEIIQRWSPIHKLNFNNENWNKTNQTMSSATLQCLIELSDQDDISSLTTLGSFLYMIAYYIDTK